MTAVPPSTAPSAPTDSGCLPPWDRADLPEPLPLGIVNLFRTIGPGAILLAAAIGGGEWIAGPMATIKFGRGILWIATVAVFLQTVFNLEAVRYTLYTGEPIMTGFMRLNPGRTFWGCYYILIGVAQLATPALAAGCGAVLFAVVKGRLPVGSSDPLFRSDQSLQHAIATGVILFSVAVLLSGKSIERVLERLSWFMIAFIFGFLILVNTLFVPWADTEKTLLGFVALQPVSNQFDLILLATFAATAGSGGLGNLAVSNWFRDKGFGMGAYSGAIGSELVGDHQGVKAIGTIFPVTTENLRRWRVWWQYTVLDQVALWAFGCLLGMFLNVNLAAALIPSNVNLEGFAAGAFQAQYMAEKMWHGFWAVALINGFWILFSTHLGNTDVLVRTVADVSCVAFPGVRRWSESRIYTVLLLALTCWAVYAVRQGSVLKLFEVLGVVACPIMAVASLQILRVNTRFLPREVRPAMWRRIVLIVCSIAYGGLTVALLMKQFAAWRGA